MDQARCAGRILHLSSYVEGVLCQKPRHLDQILRGVDEEDELKIDEKEEKDIGKGKEKDREGRKGKSEGKSINDINKNGFRSLFRWASKYDSDCIGEIIEKTINLHTTAGFALLIHPDKNIVDNDYYRLVELQKDMYQV